jgi:hypothetical protein
VNPVPTGEIDLSIPTNRAHIAQECARFVSALASGSHVTGAARVFDGCQLDIEPSASTGSIAPESTRFDDVKQLMQYIRGLGEMSGKSLGFTPPKLQLGAPNKDGWQWDPKNFYEMASLVDQLVVMTYDSSTTTPADYTNWISLQTQGVLKAVSGETWNDTSHPALAKPPRIFFGFPAMGPYNAMHVSGVETVQFAAIGVDQALTELINEGSPSQRLFAGSSTFVQGDGTGYPCRDSSGGIVDAGSDAGICETARYDTDWWWYGRYWLGSW